MPRLIALLLLFLLPGVAHADPISIIATLAPIFGGTVAAAVATTAVFVSTYGTAIAFGLNVFNAYRAKRAAKKADAEARRAYNASLKDRTITAVQQEPPERYFYGTGITGGDVVAIFTSDKTKGSPPYGVEVVKKDGLKHLVIIVASHRIKAINDVLIGGVRLGITGMSGWATASEFNNSKPYDVSVTTPGTSSSYTVTGSLLSMIGVSLRLAGANVYVPAGGAYGYSVSGNTVNLPASVLFKGEAVNADDGTWIITYMTANANDSTVYVEKFLGSSTQTANAYLMSKVPSQWTSSDRLRGKAGVVITLDLENPQFQGGIPQLTFDIDGRDEIYDPRDGLTKYTNNAALCIDDWLRSTRWGFGVTPDVDSTIEAANACDVSTAMTVYNYPPDGIGPPGPTTGYLPRYTINGAFTAADDKESVLSQMAAAMAGSVIDGANWFIQAGAWTPPVMDLVDGDEAGPIQIVQAGESMDELFNSVRASYIPAGQATVADLWPPYTNSTFVTADGTELWEDVGLPFTDHTCRARNLARIMTEVARNGLIIQYPAKLKAWELRPGQRVRVSNAEFGWTLKHFRVTDWQFGHTGAVVLTLVEDAEEAWDDADASTADPTPNTGLPNPYAPEPVTGMAAASGTAWLLKLADGTIVPRVRVDWDISESPYADNGRIDVAWRTTDGAEWTVQSVGPLDTYALLIGAPEFQTIVIRITVVNGLGVRSADTFLSHYVIGKSEPPSNVTGLTASVTPGAVDFFWNLPADADYAYTELREGFGSWASANHIAEIYASTYTWRPQALGEYIIMAKHFDTSGNESAIVATLPIEVLSLEVTGYRLDSTAAAWVLPATSAGVVTSYTGAYATIRVLAGPDDVTEAWTLSKTDGPGVTSTLSEEGLLTLTALSSSFDISYIDVVATQGALAPLGWRISISKARAGATGATGSPGEPGAAGNFIDYVFRRAATQPATPTGSGTPSGWSDAPPTGSDPLWMSTAEKTADNVLVGAWATPVRLDGAAGAPGDGVQVEYSVDGSTGWHATFTAGDLFMRQRVGAGAWSAAIRIVGEDGADGDDGSPGSPGTRTVTVEAFQWSPTTPGTPASTAFTYTWATGAISAYPSGWSAAPATDPIPGYKLWAASVTIINSTTDATSSANWNTATVTLRGVSGFDGDDGMNGTRGTVITSRAISGSVWSNTEANTAISNATGGGLPINSDQVTLYNSGTGYSESRFYSAGSWLALTAYINGNLLVDGTVQASKVVTGSLSALSANLGSITAGQMHGVAVHGGDISSWGWPPAGQRGFYLGNEGLLIGNANDQRYFQVVASTGDVMAPQFNIIGGVATFSGGLLAPTGTIGAINVTTSGHVRGGQTDYNTGTGFFLGYSGGAYKFSIGSSAQYMRWTGSALELKLNVVTPSAGTPSGTSWATSSTITRIIGSSTASASGGTAPYTFSWALASSSIESAAPAAGDWAGISASGATCNFLGRGASNCGIGVTAVCTVTDANGLTATITRSGYGSFGSGPP